MFPPSAAMHVGSQRIPETTALLARMSVQPSAARAFKYNSLIVALKVAGLYTNTKIKGLYVHAAHDAQAARLNLIENASNLSVVATMTFTTDRGYAGDGASGELTATGTADATSASLGLWVNSYGSSLGYIQSGGTNGFLQSGSTGATGRWSGTLNQNASGISPHWTMTTPDSGATLRFYKDGSLVTTQASGGSSLSLGNIHIALGQTARIAASYWGFDLSAAEVAALNAALSAYLTPIGAA